MDLKMPCIKVKLCYSRCIHGLLIGYKIDHLQEHVNNKKNKFYAYCVQGKGVYNPSFDKASFGLLANNTPLNKKLET